MVPVHSLSPHARGVVADRAFGHVHSVFSSSLNLELEGRLVHVGAAGDALSCIGFAIGPGDLARLVGGLAAGDVAVAREGAVRLYGQDGMARLALAGASLTDCGCPALDGASARWLLDRLIARHPEDRTGVDLAGSAGRALRVLAERGWEGEDGRRALMHLVGRGPGLTPSGDDALLGYAASLAMGGLGFGCARAVAGASHGRTTDVSVAYADALAEGWMNPVYADAARAARARSELDLDCALEAIAGIGHTSGWDALLGMMVGLDRVRNLASAHV